MAVGPKETWGCVSLMVGRVGSWHSWLHSPGGPRVALTCQWTGMGPSVSVWGFRGFQGWCRPAGAGKPLVLISEEEDSKMALTAPVSLWQSELPNTALPVSVSPGCPNYLLPLLEAPQHQQKSLSSLLSNCCLCSGTQSICDFCNTFLRVSLFPIPLQFSYMQTLLIFKGRHSGGSCSPCRTLGLRSLM